MVVLLLGLEPSALMHARKVPSIEQYPQALHGYEQCPKLREGCKKLLLSQCRTGEPIRSKIKEKGLFLSPRGHSMTAVKSQWGGLEAAAPPAFVGGKQRGVLLLSLLHQPWMSVHRALMFRVGLPSRLRQCRNSLKESLLDPVKSTVSIISGTLLDF